MTRFSIGMWCGQAPPTHLSAAPNTLRYPSYLRLGNALKGARPLVRPRPGFYVLRWRRGAPFVPALIYQLCPLVMPQPTTVDGPNPDEWCRPLDRSPRFAALIDGKPIAIDRIWTARSLRPVSPAEYAFRIGPLRRWARANPQMPEARPHKPVDLAALPPLF
jgi:hypothetical protein